MTKNTETISSDSDELKAKESSKLLNKKSAQKREEMSEILKTYGVELHLENGIKFTYKGKEKFAMYIQNKDGSYIVAIDDSMSQSILVEKDGSVFQYKGETEFTHISRNDDGSTQVSHGIDGPYILVK